MVFKGVFLRNPLSVLVQVRQDFDDDEDPGAPVRFSNWMTRAFVRARGRLEKCFGHIGAL